MKKSFLTKILAAALLLCGLFGLSACGTEYEDTNGADDFSLQTITDEDIVGLKTGASGLSYTEESFGNLFESKWYSAKNFNGVEQIYLNNYLMPSDVRIYMGTMNVKSGNFRLVVVNNDEIIYDFPLDTFNEEIWFHEIVGSFAIHVAGESASFKFDVQVD